MKKIIVFLLLIFLISIGGCTQLGGPSQKDVQNLVIQTLLKEKQEFENRSGTATILIKDNFFDPQTLEVKAGSYVGWENLDNKKHKILADDKSFWTPELVPHGQTGGSSGMSKKFKQVGTFVYRCTIHPEMVGTLIIKEDLPENCGDNFCSILEQQNNSCQQDCERIIG